MSGPPDATKQLMQFSVVLFACVHVSVCECVCVLLSVRVVWSEDGGC